MKTEEKRLEKINELLDDFRVKLESARLPQGHKWEVKVYDNFGESDMDGYTHGFFDTEEEAIAEAKLLINEELENAFKRMPGISAGDAFSGWGMMGNEPHIPGSSFNAWAWARKRCKELAERRALK
jgi:hypothetical protein